MMSVEKIINTCFIQNTKEVCLYEQNQFIFTDYFNSEYFSLENYEKNLQNDVNKWQRCPKRGLNHHKHFLSQKQSLSLWNLLSLILLNFCLSSHQIYLKSLSKYLHRGRSKVSWKCILMQQWVYFSFFVLLTFLKSYIN